MLTLGRKALEAVVLTVDGKTITVVVKRIKGNAVRLGIDAPADVTILRGELKDKRAA